MNDDALTLVRNAFSVAQIPIAKSSVRNFPGETIILVEVRPEDFSAAAGLASELDSKIPQGFVTVRKSQDATQKHPLARAQSILDPRVSNFIELINARSRTSEQQPSLHYILDAANNLNLAVSRRHHLIFGRRGVGKTALMLEAKKRLEDRGALTVWINIQPMRSLSAHEAFLTTASRLCDAPEVVHAARTKKPLSVSNAAKLKARIGAMLNLSKVDKRKVALIIPDLQQLFHTLGAETQEHLYLFLDDFHYLAVSEQPTFLDMINSITRDNAMWIKAAGIRHQARWFTDNPPIGLQTGHDAGIISLDVTLEQPAKAKEFLSSILASYAEEAKLGGVFGVVSREALDRLVLASGGVPRDFLILSATTIQVARQRTNAKSARVQDVNEAAGAWRKSNCKNSRTTRPLQSARLEYALMC
jgi:hypothetical protein